MKKLIYVLIFVILSSFVLGEDPHVAQINEAITGLKVESPTFAIVPLNTNYTFYAHVYNQNGTLRTNTTITCYIHIYRFTDGKHIIEQNMSFDSNKIDFEYKMNNSVITKDGEYYKIIDCKEASTSQGGFFGIGFYASTVTRATTTQDGIMYATILFILLIFFVTSLYLAFFINGKTKFTMGEQGNYIVEVNLGGYIKLGMFFLAYLIFWILTFILWNISLSFYFLGNVSGILKLIFIVVSILIFPVFFGVTIIAIMKGMTDSKLSTMAKRGLKPR